MKDLSDEEYAELRANCISASKDEFSFEKQTERYTQFLKS